MEYKKIPLYKKPTLAFHITTCSTSIEIDANTVSYIRVKELVHLCLMQE